MQSEAYPVGSIVSRPNIFSGEWRSFRVVRSGDKNLSLERIDGSMAGQVTSVPRSAIERDYELVSTP